MGFTFSHPALILPIRYFPRKLYSLNGLVIGSMIPDFEYFIRLDNTSNFSHTFLGLFLFDLPSALLILTLFHQFKEILIKNLSSFIRSRLVHLTKFNWIDYLKNNWLLVSCSILFGAITHLFWDGFTSGNGYFVRHNPFLETQSVVFNTEIYVYKIIKHVSSLIGIVILLYFLFKLPKHPNYSIKADRYFWIVFFFLTIGIILLQVTTFPYHISFNTLIKKIVASGLLAILMASLYFKIAQKQ